IASGSNGNCCLLEEKDTSILIDAGKSRREIEYRMNNLNKSPENVDAILLTHSHHDHIAGAGILSRRYNLPIYLAKEVYQEAGFKLGNAETKTFSIKNSFKIKNINIKPIKTSHNVSSCGFVIKKFGLFTDTGIITKQIENIIPKLNAVLLESNHDIDMLINGPYPYYLKQWILSDQGHLSNINASSLIQSKGKNLSLALLAHLSGNNNTPETAKKTYETLVKKRINHEICSREKETGTWKI
ncbi:MBL fold metallo-hydrolase, partial [Candidatus Woesearchaeota archaeon]|nr:MBL fold metallo-hydrolase [Candidatus Woesearchaeota archaeon]